MLLHLKKNSNLLNIILLPDFFSLEQTYPQVKTLFNLNNKILDNLG